MVVALPVLALVLVDFLLRAGGWLPPDDPLVRYARSFEESFDPFSKSRDGYLTIKSGWVNEGESLDYRRGTRKGEVFLLPAFRPTRFSRDKPVGTLRVFALGGSTTFGFSVSAAHAFPERLRTRLAEEPPERTVEMVNLGCPGWATDRIAGLVPRLIELSPDLLIVYAGHNEMLGGETGAQAGLDLASQVGERSLRWSSIVAWLHYGVSRWRHRATEGGLDEEELAAALAGRTRVFDPMLEPEERRRLPETAFLAASEERYARNLRAVSRRATAGGIPVVFVLPVANLQFPPAWSMHADEVDEQRFQALLEDARNMFAEGRFEEALEPIARAIEMSPGYAMTHYWRGIALYALGRTDEARAALRRAVHRDVRTSRITSRLETAFIEVMKEEGDRWVDLRPIFHRDLDRVSAQRLFLDHVHPTRFGHQLIADALLTEARDALAEPAGELR